MKLKTDQIQWTQKGVEDYEWPLNRLEGKALYESLFKAIVRYGRSLESEEAKTVLKILSTEICLIVHAVCLSEKIFHHQKDKISPSDIPDRHLFWSAACNQDYSILSDFSFYAFERGLQTSSAWKKYLRPIKYWGVKGFKRGNLKTLDSDQDIACIAYSPLAVDHQKNIQKPVTLLSYDEWFYPPESKAQPYNDLKIVDALTEVTDQQGFNISESAKDFLYHIIARNAGWVQFYMKRLDHLKIPQQLWLTSMGNSYGRLLAAKVLEKEGKVVVHDHAQGGNFSNDYHVGFNEFQLASEFITFTAHQADYYQRIVSDVTIDNAVKVKSFTKSDQVFLMPDHPVQIKDKEKRKKTILYPCPLINRDVSGAVPLMGGAEIIDWQARLFTALNEAGYQIHFKPHPLTKQHFPDYEAVFDLITIEKPFEQAMADAEHMLFDWTLTTTFGNALFSDRPITVIDFGVARYDSQEKHILSDRCHWIEGTIDEENRSQTNWKDLISCIDNPKAYDGTK